MENIGSRTTESVVPTQETMPMKYTSYILQVVICIEILRDLELIEIPMQIMEPGLSWDKTCIFYGYGCLLYRIHCIL